MTIGSDRTVSMDLVSSVNGEKVGFQIEISKLAQGSAAIVGTNKKSPVHEFEMTISDSGELTPRLEKHLLQTFSDSANDQVIRLNGIYNAISSQTGVSLTHPSVFKAWGVLFPRDLEGNLIINGENFDIRLFLDAPFKRAVGYFSIPPGYGGSSSADWARKQWLESLEITEETTPKEHTPEDQR